LLYHNIKNKLASETMWLLNLLNELGFPLQAPPSLLYDNLRATHLSFNLVHHSQIKLIQINLYFICDLIQKGIINIKHVHTQDWLAVLPTKPLSR